MRSCFQTPSQSVWQHGEAVRDKFDELLGILQGAPADAQHWRLPSWLTDNPAPFLARLLDKDTLAQYQLWHDCGKPFCRTVDDAGAQHFPDHAIASATMWARAGGDAQVGALIANDMVLHTCSAVELEAIALTPEAASLYLTALAEIHANAQLFGGVNSISFKTKFKHLDRRGRALSRVWAVR